MKRHWLNGCCRWVAIVVLAVTPATALAQDEKERDIIDARLEGYTANKTLPGGGTAGAWIAFVALGILVVAGLFKDAKRSHLD